MMDLGQAIDNKTLLAENSYQLIVSPTSTRPHPFQNSADLIKGP